MIDKSAKPWLKIYPEGMPHEIDPSPYASLAEMIVGTCLKYGSLTAFSNMGVPLSFAEIERLSEKMAAFYQSTLGLKKGDRIIIQMPNLLQYPVALFGAIRAGLVVVNTNPLYTSDEMQKNFQDSGAVAIVILENFADKLEPILGQTAIKHIILTEVGDLLPFPKRAIVNFVLRHIKKMVPRHGLKATHFRDALSAGLHAPFTPPPLGRADLAFLQYTGGTTGVSKAAELTHHNLLSNLYQMLEWLSPALEEGKEVVIAALPLYHVFCLTVNCFGLFAYGGHNVLITNPRDLPAFIKTLITTKPTVMSAVSTLLAGLLNHPDFPKFDPKTLRVTVAGGMALNGSVAKEWKRRTKSMLIEGYGLTETSPVVSCNPLDGRDRLGTIGMPLPSTEVCIVDDSGESLGPNTPGELCVRGPQVMRGYWKRDDETRKVLDPDGWLHTGDIAVMEPDGFFKIVDRKKDMILVSGFNVYPNEIEDVVMHHPKVLEAAAIGVPDEHSGEVVKLFVVKRDPSLTAEELQTYLHAKITGYKRPKTIEFRTELPKSNVGKILRRELR
jgi:long-chain acyl-CoA synthetase